MMQRALASVGIAFLLLVHPFLDLVASQSMIRYHSAFSLAPLVCSLLLSLFALSALFLCVMLAAARCGIWQWLRLPLAAWLPLLLARRIAMLSGYPLSSRLVQCAFVLLLAALVYAAFRRRVLVEATLRNGLLLLACLGASFIFFVPQLVRLAIWRPAQPISVQAEVTGNHASHPRIVWIVLDELSYDQTFGHREPGLVLPAFDALRNISTTYENVEPIGDKTDRVLPSLLLGQRIDDIAYTWSNQLAVQQPVSLEWTRFHAADTIFANARAHGWSTGVVGWYNPYCSLLAPYLDSCFWTNEDMDKAAWTLAPGTSVLSGALDGLRALAGSRAAKQAVLTETARSRLHLESEQQAYEHALAMSADGQMDLLLLHLPVPHFPNVYDRRTGQFNLARHSYADNLALADRDLGGLLAVLEKSPRWRNTTVVVCGDHSWRTTWWRPTPYWTAEDERISHGGVFDPRPMLMVHFAGESRTFTNAEDISLLEAHRIVASLITTGMVQVDSANAGTQTAAGAPAR